MAGTTTHEELAAMIDRNDDFYLLDVLPEESYLKEHLPGAINIPLHAENFEIMAEKLMPDQSLPVVVYDINSDSAASSEASAKLIELGYKNVSDYENGIEEWIEMGYDLDE